MSSPISVTPYLGVLNLLSWNQYNTTSSPSIHDTNNIHNNNNNGNYFNNHNNNNNNNNNNNADSDYYRSINKSADDDYNNNFNYYTDDSATAATSSEAAADFTTIKQPPHLLVLFIVAYSIIFMGALVGNTMVVAVVMLRPGMRSVTNLFIANLAIADMLVAVLCIPITLMDNIYFGWPFGEVLCKLTPYVQGVSVCASVYNLAAIAVDRYLAICFKPQFRIMRRGACLILVGIWVFSFLLLLPWLVYYQHVKLNMDGQPIELCMAAFPSVAAEKAYFLLAIFLGTYILPLSVVFLCYVLIARRVWQRRAPGVATSCNVIKRYRVKVIKMLITVVAVFALSWLPLHTIFILIYFVFPADKRIRNQITNVGVPLAQWLELSNSGMNAIIYCFFSENFRRGFMDLFRCMRKRRNMKFMRGNSSALPPRRVRRSLSEESTMMGSCVVHRPQTSSQRSDTKGKNFLRMRASEKRTVWRQAHCSGSDVTLSSSTIVTTNAVTHKNVKVKGRPAHSGANTRNIMSWPRRHFELSQLQNMNGEERSSVDNNMIKTCCDDCCSVIH